MILYAFLAAILNILDILGKKVFPNDVCDMQLHESPFEHEEF